MTKLFVDLETIPDQAPDARVQARMRVKVPGNYKNPDIIEKFRDEHTDEVWAKGALEGIAGEICSIAWAIDDGSVDSLTRGATVDVDDEAGLLRAFFERVNDTRQSGEGGYPRIEWIGHNVIDFDLRFLKQRSLILGVKPSAHIPADARHGGVSAAVFDTMKEWAGFRGYVKQSALQSVFDITAIENAELEGGHQVLEFWRAARFEEIGDYNRDDVRVCREIYRRLTWS